MERNYSIFTDKDCIIYLSNGEKTKGHIDAVVDEGEEKEQYILLGKGKGFYFDQIDHIEPL